MDKTTQAGRDDRGQFKTHFHLAAALHDADAENAEDLARFAYQNDSYGWNQRQALEAKLFIFRQRHAEIARDIAAIETVRDTLPEGDFREYD